jgi:hypothetical protein
LFKACCTYNILTFTRFPRKHEEWLEEAAEPATYPDEPQIKDYREESENYDAFLETMWRYLDLINRTSVLIEDLFLLLLTGLGYNRPNDKTIFKQVLW